MVLKGGREKSQETPETRSKGARRQERETEGMSKCRMQIADYRLQNPGNVREISQRSYQDAKCRMARD
jgi:hypothetical protein